MLDRVISADSGSSGVATWAEPMVLRSTSRASPQSLVGSSVDSLSEDFVSEDGVVRDNSSGQVVRNRLADVQDLVELRISVLSHDLEWSEKLSCQ